MNPAEFLARIAANPRENRVKRRLAQHVLGEAAPSSMAPVVGGQYNAPVVGLPARALGAALNALGLGLEGSGRVAQAGTGIFAGGVGAQLRRGEQLTPQTAGEALTNPLEAVGLLAHLGEMATGRNILDAGPLGRDAYTDAADALQGGGNLWDRGLAANEAAAGGGTMTPRSIATGLSNMLADPTNFLAPGAAMAKGAGLSRTAKALALADRIQNMPIEAVTKLVRGGKNLPGRIAARRIASIAANGPETLPPLNVPTGAAPPPVPPLRVPTAKVVPPAMPGAGAPPLPPSFTPGPRVQPPPFHPAMLATPPPLRAESFADALDPLLDEALPLDPTKAEWNKLQRQRGLVPLPTNERPAVKGLPEPNPLVPDKTPDLLRIAKRFERLATEAAPPANESISPQLPLAEAKVLPGDLPSAPLTQALDSGQRSMVDQFRDVLWDGSERDVLDFEDFLRDTMGVRPDTLASIKDEALGLVEQERKAASLARIEQSPYFKAFRHFDKRGELKQVNPITGQRLRVRPSVGDLTGNGYDELAANLLDEYQTGDYNQNWGQTTEEFWTNAQRVFREYRGLRAVKRVADEGVPKFAPPEAVAVADEAAAKALPEPPPTEGLPWMPREVAQEGPEALLDLPTPAGTRDEALAAISGAQTRTLLELAYDHPNAIRNAQAKYRDPIGLRARAIDRITQDGDRVAQLGARDPELARLVAALPDDAAALPDNVDIPPAVDNAATIAKGKAAKADLFSDAGDIAAGGGGGGGMGLLPYPGGLSGPIGRALLPALGGGLTGAAGGAAIGAATNEDDRIGGALKGGLIGAGVGYAAGGGASMANLDQLVKSPEFKRLADDGSMYAKMATNAADVADAAAAAAPTWSKPTAKGLAGYWRRSTVEHFKNWFQDNGWGRLVIRALQGGDASKLITPMRADLVDRMKLTGFDALSGPMQLALSATGKEGYIPKLGQSLNQQTRHAGKGQSAAETAIYGGLLSALNPSGFAQNVVGVGLGAARGAADKWWSPFYNAISDVLQKSFRETIFLSEYDQALREADTLLRQKHGLAANALPANGLYTADDVAAVAGPQAGRDWQAYLDTAVDAGESRARFLMGDYGEQSKWERAIGGAIPFTSWMFRAYPVAIAMALEHPAMALGVFHFLQATSQGAGKDGRPGYTAGMLPVDTETPLAGAFVRLLLGGQEGTAYLDPVGAFSPVGGDAFQPAEPGVEKNWYQQTGDTLSRVGLPGFNPLVAGGAYALGLDWKAPGALSRTQGLENAAAMLPGNPQLPDIGGGLLRGLRGALSPIAAKVIPGAEADFSPDQYDPITKRYAELVLEATGRPLNDPSNRDRLLALVDGDDPLVRKARAQVLLGGGFKSAVSLTSPVGVATQGKGAREVAAVKKASPWTYDEIQRALADNPQRGQAMQQAVDRYNRANPATAAYRIGNRAQAEDALLAGYIKAYQRAGYSQAQATAAARQQVAREQERRVSP